jgi:phospholipase/lecithinase/hemolysin
MEDTQMKAPALEGWRSRRLVAALLAAALLGVSCGGGSDTPAESTPTVAQADPEATQAAAQLAAGGREEAMAVDAARLFAPRTRQVVVFGDSLSDVGTYKVDKIARAGGGKFTTNPGPVWPETIGLLLGARVTPFRQGFGGQSQVLGGTGFAMGGSRVSQQPGINCNPHPDTDECTAALTIPITRQIDDYLGFPANGGRFTRNQLVFVFAGGNDVIFQLQELGKKDSSVTVEQALRAVQQAALDLAGQVRRILDNGATRVAVMTLPDIADSIFGRAAEQSTRDLMTAMTQTFNGTLAAALDGTRAKLIDAHAHSKDVSEHPVKYFITELNVPACDVAKVAEITLGQVTDGSSLFCSLRTLVQNDAPIRYLYADSVHPTTLGHLLFARFVLIELWRQGLL